MVSQSQIMKEEILKCANDPAYFMKHYCYIQHPQKGKILFKLYPFQEQVLTALKENRYSIILKSRQLGISTLSAGFSLWMSLFQTDKTILVVATTQNVATNLVTKVRTMYELLPKWFKTDELQTIAIENNKLSIGFQNGSRVIATACTPTAGRSYSISCLIIDEMAFINENLIQELWSAVFPTLSTGGRAILLSTPSGVGNLYHKQYMQAISGENGFLPIKLHWTVHPEHDQKWRDEQDRILGKTLASQECDTDFLQSGETVIHREILNYYLENSITPPIETRGHEKELWIWQYPDYSRDYLISADVSRGDGADFSAFHILDVETLEQVAEFKGKIGTKEYGNLLMTLATEYNNALLVVENANIGWAVLQQIIDRGYENLYYSIKTNSTISDIEVFTKKGYDLKNKEDMIPGFTTSSKTRPLLIEKLQLYLNEKSVKLNSRRTLNELEVFIWLRNKAQAQHGYNDDLIMSLAIGLWIRDTAIKLRQQGIELNRFTVNNTQSTLPPILSSRNYEDKFKIQTDHGKIDIGWVL